MSTRMTIIISLFLVLAAVVLSLSIYNQLPEQVASHWNMNDEVDGYMPRFWGAFLMPLVALALLGLLLVIPHLDPHKANIASFRGPFNAFVLLLVAFMLYLHVLTLLWNLGYQDIKLSAVLLPAVGLILAFAGVLMGKTKRNFFIGIRTPWTLSSDTVWEQTHRLGSKLFVVMGLLVMLASLFGQTGLLMVLPVILLSVLAPVIYSYILYRRETRA
jgi:uncharacterized membrane protein